MSTTKDLLTNWRIIVLILTIVMALVVVHPVLDPSGVTIRNVAANSSAAFASIQSSSPTELPVNREVITLVNNIPILDESDYYAAIQGLRPNQTVQLVTDKATYRLTTRPSIATINGTEQIVGTEDIGISVYDAPASNLRKGLDLQGGTRVILQPAEELSDADFDTLLENMKYRLNVYGLSDLVVRETSDLSGNRYILVEIAGATEQEVHTLLAQQGKFEAKISNETVFRGGTDITYVCRTPECSGIDPQYGCQQTSDAQWSCRFAFSISLTPDAAQRQADLTQNLPVVQGGTEGYLNESIDLYLDNALVDSLQIGASLKGRAVTEIQISGSGIGRNNQEAITNALDNMKRLQTILITGSLPVQLNIIKTDTISAVLGEEFIDSAITMGLIVLAAIAVVIWLRYRKLRIVIPVFMTSIVEVILLLGVTALFGANIDLAAVAGIIITIGMGVNDQIVITDEILRGESSNLDWKRRIKNAFYIIIAIILTLCVAMLPLVFAGAGLLRGFAITTIAGALIGAFISRPAFAVVIEKLLNK